MTVPQIVSVVPNTEYVFSITGDNGQQRMECPTHLVFFSDGEVGYFGEHDIMHPSKLDENGGWVRHRVLPAERAAFIEHNRKRGVIMGRELA